MTAPAPLRLNGVPDSLAALLALIPGPVAPRPVPPESVSARDGRAVAAAGFEGPRGRRYGGRRASLSHHIAAMDHVLPPPADPAPLLDRVRRAARQEQFLEVQPAAEAERRFHAALDLRPLPAEAVPLAAALGFAPAGP